MDFGSFIVAFGSGYNRLIDPATNKALIKPLFCRKLLCNITNDENIVLYIDGIADGKHARGETTFQAFYRNKERRSLHPIAEPIINNNGIDKKKFHSFLEVYTQYFNKDKLFYNFKKELPNVSSFFTKSLSSSLCFQSHCQTATKQLILQLWMKSLV